MSAIVITPFYVQTASLPTPLFHYTMDDPDSSVFTDSGPSGNDGSYSGGSLYNRPALYTDGGTAVQFRGEDWADAASLYGDIGSNPLYPITISIHFELDALDTWVPIFATNQDEFTSRGISAFIGDIGEVKIVLGGGDSWSNGDYRLFEDSSANVTDSTTYNLIVTLTDVDTIEAWLNGVALSFNTNDGPSWTGEINTSEGVISLGQVSAPDENIYYSAFVTIDNFIAFQSVLTAGQRALLA